MPNSKKNQTLKVKKKKLNIEENKMFSQHCLEKEFKVGNKNDLKKKNDFTELSRSSGEIYR